MKPNLSTVTKKLINLKNPEYTGSLRYRLTHNPKAEAISFENKLVGTMSSKRAKDIIKAGLPFRNHFTKTHTPVFKYLASGPPIRTKELISVLKSYETYKKNPTKNAAKMFRRKMVDFQIKSGNRTHAMGRVKITKL